MNNILGLLSEQGIEVRKASGTKGGEYHSPCPGCGGEDRFHAWPEQNNREGSWWCRGCELGGDCIQFLREFSGLSFKEAAARMGREVNTADYHGRTQRVEEKHQSGRSQPALDVSAPEDPDETWQTRARALMDYATEKIQTNDRQMAWLASRGLTRESVQRFHLGWIPEDMFRERSSWGLPPGDISPKTGRPKKLWIPTGLIIPCLRDGRVVRVRIRRPEGEPRYYVLPGSVMDPQPLLYLASSWQGRTECIVICESELDGLLIFQEAGDLVSVLALGASHVKPRDERAHQALAGQGGRKPVIVLAMDADDAGQKAAVWWQENYPRTRLATMPEGCKDPGEIVPAGHDLRQWLVGHLPGAGAAWVGQFASGQDNQRGEGRKNFLNSPALQEGESGRTRAVSTPAPVAESVKRLGDLLKVAPVMLIHEPGRFACLPLKEKNGEWVEDAGWWDRHEDLGKEINRLFWYDQDVKDWVDQHPDEKITRKNFWKPLENNK